jgi:antitoxin ParD1/3/4
MPTRNVSLTPELDRFVAEKVAAGLYANASEVMRTALRRLEQDEREYEAKLAALRAAIDEGDACYPADDVDGEEFFEQLRQRIADRDQVKKEERVA